jgi:hypothetical protein
MATDFLALGTPVAAAPPPPVLPRRSPQATRPTAAPVVRDAARIYGLEDFGVVPPSARRVSRSRR